MTRSTLKHFSGTVFVLMLMLNCGFAFAQSSGGNPAQGQDSTSTRVPNQKNFVDSSQPNAPNRATSGSKGSGTAPSGRKAERSYRFCKEKAMQRALKGVERRAFIRRCELGFPLSKS